METTMREISEDLLTYLDNQIKTKRQSHSAPPLSNYQTATSKANFEKIVNENGPAFIDAGSNAGGYSQYYYYKNKNNEIYIVDFYVQEFESYYKIENDNDSWKTAMFGQHVNST